MIRQCVHCKAEIIACFGFTFARDLAAHFVGIRFARELCGQCMTIRDLPDIARAAGFTLSPEHEAAAAAIQAHYAWPDPICEGDPA